MESAGLELVTDESEPEHPAPESVFLIVRFGLSGRGFLLGQGLMSDGQAELNVCLDFPSVECPVEKSIHYFVGYFYPSFCCEILQCGQRRRQTDNPRSTIVKIYGGNLRK